LNYGATGINISISKINEISATVLLRINMLNSQLILSDHVIEQLPGCLFIKDLRLQFVDANKTFLQDAGVRLDDIKGLNDADMPWQFMQHKYRQDDLTVLHKQSLLSTVEMHVNQEGKRFQVLVTKKCLYSSHHKKIGIIGFFQALPAATENSLQTLSKRQQTVYHLLIQGKTAKEISVSLALSHRTIQYYTDLIKTKLNCRTKSDLINYYYGRA
jgi:DNA-binding CsgD family transcriptional regulator